MSCRKKPVSSAALIVILLAGSSLATAQTRLIDYHPCTSSKDTNYPVVVYDALNRQSKIMLRDEAARLSGPPGSVGKIAVPPVSDIDTATKVNFLCSQYPVTVFVVNRRLRTDFTISLTAAIKSENGHLSISGYTPPAAPQSSSPSTTGSAAPAAKGFAPLANGNLLTTDAIINYLLNDETFDRPLARIRDDASAVQAQATQFRANYIAYISKMNELIGTAAPAVAPRGNISVAAVTGEFNSLATAATGGITTEQQFDDLLERADRTQQEIARINTQLADYPVVDTLGNLRASASILRDNIRGVLTEYNSLYLAISVLQDLNDNAAGKPSDKTESQRERQEYLHERRMAEIRSMLRSQFPSATTIDEATLARIVANLDLPSGPLDLTGPLAFKARLHNLRDAIGIDFPESPEGLAHRFVQAINETLALPRESGLPRISDERLDYLSATAPVPSISFNAAFDDTNDELAALRDGITSMNGAVAQALRAINNIYDTSYASYEELPFDLTAYGKNLNVYYTIAGSERFHRYQIVNEVAQPQSACALTEDANTSIGGGALTCTTASGSAPPAASTTFSSTVPAYAAGAASGGAASPTSAPAAAPGGGSQTATAAQPSSPSLPPDYHGSFQLHHYSDGQLITGVGYDSVAGSSNSYSWFTCPLNKALFPNGSTDPTSCASFQTPSTTPGGAPTTTSYYMLNQYSQLPVAAIQGVNLYAFGPKDTFVSRPRNLMVPDVFLGAAAYPIDHFYLGLSETPIRGVSITAGAAFGSQTYLPSTASYQVGSVYASNPTIAASTRFRTGFFVMLGFPTSLFKNIFTGSAFQNVLQIGNAGASTAQPSQ